MDTIFDIKMSKCVCRIQFSPIHSYNEIPLKRVKKFIIHPPVNYKRDIIENYRENYESTSFQLSLIIRIIYARPANVESI